MISAGRQDAAGWAGRLFGLYALAAFALLVVLGWLTVLFVPALPRRRRIIRGLARRLLAAAGIPVHVAGAAHLQARRPCIVVANHTSNLDVIALIAILPDDIRFVAKSEFERNPATRTLMRGVGTVFVERFKRQGGPGSTRRIVAALDRCLSVLVFPEGTFRAEPGLWPFRMGAFAAAAEQALPVVPVAIVGARQILPARHLLPRRGTVRIVIMPPIQPLGRDRLAAENLRDAAYQAILAQCGEPAVVCPSRAA